jgi:hypothetical protein
MSVCEQPFGTAATTSSTNEDRRWRKRCLCAGAAFSETNLIGQNTNDGGA